MPLLLREAIGERLRRARIGQRRTLRDVSKAAKVSLGYLSEVERGRKEFGRELDRDLDRELDRVIEGGRLARAAAGEAKADLRIAPALTHRLGKPISGSPVASALPNAGLSAVGRAVVVAA
jgi:transcriptional regulator with XRE-family HTH domain